LLGLVRKAGACRQQHTQQHQDNLSDPTKEHHVLCVVSAFGHVADDSRLGLPGFDPMAFMGSESQLLTWQGQGLPSDTLSGQNALAILHGVQTPFIIDPSSQVCL
jgi:hypothetical protein